MRKVLLVLAAVMALFVTPALAADGSTYNVKYNAVSAREVYDAVLEAEFPEGGASITTPPITINMDRTVTVSKGEDIRSVHLRVIHPTFTAQTIPSISADSTHNASVGALQDYIYKYSALTQTNQEYDAALGTAPEFKLNKYNVGRDYDAKGKTYTLEQTFLDQKITQTLTVSPVTQSRPDVYVDDDGILYCSPERVQYSFDRQVWSSIKDGDRIPEKAYGATIYVRTPAGSFSEASSAVSLDIKDKQSPPTEKLELESTSFSVTITNPEEFSGCEFSINNGRWTKDTSWDDLEPDTRYTVRARYTSDRYYFASSPISNSISTKQGAKNEITYETSSNAHTTYFIGTGTTRVTVRNGVLSASYDEKVVSSLKRAIKNAEKRMSAVTVLDVSMVREEGDDRKADTVRFKIPGDMGLLQLRLSTPYCTIITSDNTKDITLEHMSHTNSKVKAFSAGKDLIYSVKTDGKGSIQILYPWEFPDRADLSGLRITYVPTGSTSERVVKYQVVDDGILFALPGDGYFTITNLHRSYGTLPFVDSQTHWAYSYIYYNYENGLVNGISSTEFAPDALVTRSQLVTLLARLSGASSEQQYSHPFKDVPADSWYSWAVGYLYQKDAVTPKADGTFGPDDAVTREEMAIMVGKVFPYNGTIWRPFNCKDRDQVGTNALNAIDGLYNQRILTGDDKGNFNPSSTMTSGEFATILYRLATL